MQDTLSRTIVLPDKRNAPESEWREMPLRWDVSGASAYPKDMSEAEQSQGSEKSGGFNVKMFVLTLVLGIIVGPVIGLVAGASVGSLPIWALVGAAVGAILGAILATSVHEEEPTKDSGQA